MTKVRRRRNVIAAVAAGLRAQALELRAQAVKAEEKGGRTARYQRPSARLAALLAEKAPEHPVCFRSREDWLSWLHDAEASCEVHVLRRQGRIGTGEANRGRRKTSELNVEIDFCRDCTAERRERMYAQGRCIPRAGCNPPPMDPIEQQASPTTTTTEDDES